jgi:hypothetical protein
MCFAEDDANHTTPCKNNVIMRSVRCLQTPQHHQTTVKHNRKQTFQSKCSRHLVQTQRHENTSKCIAKTTYYAIIVSKKMDENLRSPDKTQYKMMPQHPKLLNTLRNNTTCCGDRLQYLFEATSHTF